MNKKIIILLSAVIAIFVSICLVLMLTNGKSKSYTVTFETNGGTKINIQIINEGETVVKPNDPEKEGYIFVQWLYEGKTYDFSSSVKSNLILTAEYIEKTEKAETFIVSFNSDGGTTIPNQIVAKGNKIIMPIAPTKEGYIFKGWILNNLDYNFELIVESNLELIAKWEKIEEKVEKPSTNVNGNNNKPTKKEYTITFNSNGGSSVSNQKVPEGNKVIKPNNPTKTNHLFKGWFIGENEYNFNTKVTSNLTLVARWLLYGDVNLDGAINAKDTAYLNRHLSGNQSLTGENLIAADVNLDNKINDIDVAILRKYFGEWITTLPYSSGETYNISYDLNGGVLSTRNYVIYTSISLPYTLNNPKKDGYVFSGWTGSNGTTAQTTVTIQNNTTGNLNYSANWVLYGDVNQDGNTNSTDVVYISRYISGNIELSNTQLLVADTNSDGLINQSDVDVLREYISAKEG